MFWIGTIIFLWYYKGIFIFFWPSFSSSYYYSSSSAKELLLLFCFSWILIPVKEINSWISSGYCFFLRSSKRTSFYSDYKVGWGYAYFFISSSLISFSYFIYYNFGFSSLFACIDFNSFLNVWIKLFCSKIWTFKAEN